MPEDQSRNNAVRVIAFSRNGALLAVGYDSGRVCVWDLGDGRLVVERTFSRREIQVATFHPEKPEVLVIAGGSTVCELDVKAGKTAFWPLREVHKGKKFAVSPKGKTLCTALFDARKSIIVVDVVSRKVIAHLSAASNPTRAVSVDDNGRFVFVADDLHVYMYASNSDVPIWKLTYALDVGDYCANQLAFSPTNQLCAVGIDEREGLTASVYFLDLIKGEEKRHLWVVGDYVRFAFSGNGTRLATASGLSSRIDIWDAPCGKRLGRCTGGETATSCVSFSQDGRWIANGNWDGTVRLWDVNAVVLASTENRNDTGREAEKTQPAIRLESPFPE
jgi:WD40 repeat protein